MPSSTPLVIPESNQAENAVPVSFDGPGSLNHGLQSAVRGPEIPPFQEIFRFFLGLFVQLLKVSLI